MAAKKKAAAKKRMGRPPRAGVLSSHAITVRFTREEHEQIVVAANKSYKTIAAWLRDLALAASKSC
ncbi:MAG: hypothetical protein FWD73_02330 [Polyangiaceae bacterium]|nr:hypothetical protein [Polyangiaceae bacterium]